MFPPLPFAKIHCFLCHPETSHFLSLHKTMHIIPFQPRPSCTYTLTIFLLSEIQNVPVCGTITASISSTLTPTQLTPFLCMRKGCSVIWFSFSLCCLLTDLRVSQLPHMWFLLYKNVCSSKSRHDASLCQKYLVDALSCLETPTGFAVYWVSWSCKLHTLFRQYCDVVTRIKSSDICKKQTQWGPFPLH